GGSRQAPPLRRIVREKARPQADLGACESRAFASAVDERRKAFLDVLLNLRTMRDLADFIARNVLWLLLVATFLWLLLMAAFWHLVTEYAPKLWSRVISAWDAWRETSLARRLARLPVLGSVLSRAM